MVEQIPDTVALVVTRPSISRTRWRPYPAASYSFETEAEDLSRPSTNVTEGHK
jgi:hypothetical protein